MANEREFESGSSSKNFYSIDSDGNLFRKATQQEIDSNAKNLKSHTKEKGVKAGEIEIRKLVACIFGYPTAFWVKSSEEFGDSLVVELTENGFTSVLQMPFNGNYSDDLIRKVSNMKEGSKYELQSWKVPKKDMKTGKLIPEKFVRGMSIKDEVGNKIEKYITKEIQEKLLPLSAAPFYEKDSETQTKAFWEIYFKMLFAKFKETVVPKAQQRFATWYEANKEVSISIDDDYCNDFDELLKSEPTKEESPFPTMQDAPVKNDDEDLPW